MYIIYTIVFFMCQYNTKLWETMLQTSIPMKIYSKISVMTP